MSDRSCARLSCGQRTAVGISVTLGLALAGYGMAGSYETVSDLARHEWVPLLEPEGTLLTSTVLSPGVFGGRVTPNAAVYIQVADSLFSKVKTATVRVTGSNGQIATPTKLLSGVGSSVCGVSADAVSAFSTDAIPQLSSISQTRTVIPVGTLYTLTVVVVDSSTLAFVYTPSGVDAPAGSELIGA